jgi:hypothetical protein
MKRLVILFFIILVGCSEETYNWKFEIRTDISVNKTVSGYPQTIFTTFTRSQITTEEASAIVEENNTISTSSQYIQDIGTVTVTTKTICSKTQKP